MVIADLKKRKEKEANKKQIKYPKKVSKLIEKLEYFLPITHDQFYTCLDVDTEGKV